MKWFYDLKISKKLLLSFSLLSLMTITLGCFSIFQLNQVNKASTEIATNWLPSIQALAKIELTLSKARNFELLHIVAAPNTTLESDAEASANEELDALTKYQKLYVTLISEPQEKVTYPLVDKEIQIFVAEHAKIIALSRAGKKQEAAALLNAQSGQSFKSATAMLAKLSKVNEQGSIASNTIADNTYSAAITMISGTLLVLTLISLLLAITVAKIVSTPMREALVIAQRVAQGDLNSVIEARSKDETGELMHALKVMNDSLYQIVSEVRVGTDTINTASGEIAAGNLDLSSRTEEQASSLEETASAMEELTSTIKQNADNAHQASQLAISASDVAQQGGTVVNQVVDTMSAINESSRKIVDIIGVIDGIAFQTNILALNAAVEAARAGEQGRGFAVVASEVRSLAQRSATAAKEIKVLIDDSVAKVGDGSKLVAQAGTTMEEIVSSISRVTTIVSDISAASMEQSNGIEQINQAVTQMDEVTQQNAALVEQAAAAAQSLQDQAGQLTQAVSIFKLNRTETVTHTQSTSTVSRSLMPQPARLARINSKPFAAQGRRAVENNGDSSWEQF